MIDWQSVFCWHNFRVIARAEYIETMGERVVSKSPMYTLQCEKCGRLKVQVL